MKTYNLLAIIKSTILSVVLIFLTSHISLSYQLTDYIPENLKPWADWVLHDKRSSIECIPHFNDSEALRCAFPTSITLNLNSKGGEFTQEWQIYHESYIYLPGNNSNWTHDVIVKPGFMESQDTIINKDTLQSQSAIINRSVVIQHNDPYGNVIPSIKLSQGKYTVTGRFIWDKPPEYIQIPPESGFVKLIMDNREIEFPHLDDLGRLWLKSATVVESKEENRLKVESFRLIDDSIPSLVTLYVTIDVAGVAREVKLGPIYSPKEFIPMALNTNLPSKLESDGTIRIQLKPGSYTLSLTLRHIGQFQNLTFEPPEDGYWSKQEIWSVVRRPDLRVVEISGVNAIDPRITSLPQEWKSYPAYMLLPKETMQFKEIKRGDPIPPPDQLSLHRMLWLAFDGTGYTVQDSITGNKNSGWHLEIEPLMLPGKVTVDGVEQLITRLNFSNIDGVESSKRNKAQQPKNIGDQNNLGQSQHNAGVELRRGKLNLVADSKIEGSIYKIPATGWIHSFQRVTGTLNLPAGWKLISAQGIDNIPGTWVKRWSLLDIFIVLIFTIATAKLFSAPLAVVGFITMALIYHESGSPRYIWLFLLLGFVLLDLTAKNSGRLRKAVKFYQSVTVIILILISISYAVESLKIGIYPQLENRWVSMNDAINNQNLSNISKMGGANEEFGLPESNMTQMDIDKSVGQLPNAAPAPEEAQTDAYNMAEEQTQYRNKAKGQLMDMPNKTMGPLAYLKSEKDMLQRSLESKVDSPIYGQRGVNKKTKVMQYDPKSLTQTGPGLPLWQPFKTINFSWSGPVESGQTISFTLIGPKANLILAFLRVALIILLAVGMFLNAGYLSGKLKKSGSISIISMLFGSSYLGNNFKKSVFGILILIFTLLSPCLISASEIPSPEILAELQNRLLEKDKCFPNCADISRMEISIKFQEFPNQPLINREFSNQKLLDQTLANQEPANKKLSKSTYLELNLNVDAAVDTVIPLPGHARHWLPEQVIVKTLNSQYMNNKNAHNQDVALNGQNINLNTQPLFRLDQILWVMIPAGKHRITVLGKIGNPNSFQLPLNIRPHSGKVIDANGWEVQGMQPDGTLDDQLQFKRLAGKSRDRAGKSGKKEDRETPEDGSIGTEEDGSIETAEGLETGLLPPFTLVERTILLGLDWKVETTVRRLTPTGSAIVLKLPLLKGESVITEGVRVKNGMVEVTLNSEQSTISFESFLEISETLRLYHALSSDSSNNDKRENEQSKIKKEQPKETEQNKATLNNNEQTQNLEWTEIWRLDASPIFHVETEGIPVILHQNNQRWYPTWHPLPGEEVILKISKPKGIGGQTMTIEKSTLELHPGQRTTSSTLSISIKSSQGGQHAITIPEKAQLQEVKINGAVQIIRQEGQKVILPITPGVQNIELVWKEEIGITTLYRTPKIDLGISSVNSAVDLHISSDRWTLFVGGEQLMGPAVLFWSKIIVVLLVSIGLAMTNLTPLKFYQWFLLGIGMSMSNVVGSMVVAAWLIVLDMRKKWGEGLSPTKFNIMQLGIAGLTFFSMICLLMAISQGLLGHPSMNIVGNGSSGNFLRWYQDISDNTLPVAWLFSLPMFAYRVAMLAWALWLSFWLLSILKWGWHNFSDPILWAAHSKHDDAVNSNTNAQSESLISDKDNQLQKPKNIFSIKNIFRFGKS